MTLLRRLADHALVQHPEHATSILERLDEDEATRLLERTNVGGAAAILSRLSPQFAASVFGSLSRDHAAKLIDALSVDQATRLLRRADEDLQNAILERLDPKRARSIRGVLRYPAGTAGALMDPEVAALPQDLRASEALERLRASGERVRYNVYVVDQQQRLVGALNLGELFVARETLRLVDIMVRDPQRLLATADRGSILAHEGWKHVHMLPVVDASGAFVGVIRYRAFRALEAAVFASRLADADTSAALGQLIAASARGLLDAFSTPTSGPGSSGHG